MRRAGDTTTLLEAGQEFATDPAFADRSLLPLEVACQDRWWPFLAPTTRVVGRCRVGVTR